ncbi:MAG TPA: DEDD exonuclease domain-containing protein [Actinomycetaceae bacterium]|nr:DEDD exonuclease domain-containing protein [Actinomycetaceae bacterium]
MNPVASFAPPPGRRLPLEPRDRARVSAQPTFEDLGTPLQEVEFVVVDLETTGGSPGAHAITEIGAVRVKAGEVLGEFATLVNPGSPIPPMITVLTGITTAMVMEAPVIEDVLPSFMEWSGLARGVVLVAHNARFDVGFLRAACAELDIPWPRPTVVDTLALARRALTRDEVPNHKLGTLARVFRTSVEPAHRALADAQATTDVLHGLLGRLTPLGVTHLEDLATAADPVPPARRRKSSLADDVPRGPGVYQFIGPAGEVLYVGTATDLRSRVRSYFTSAEKRRRIGEMVDLAAEVRSIPCGSVIEAHVRELRLIDEHQPAYNRRSRRASSRPWVRLTDDAHPRLSVVRSMPVTALDVAWGPFRSRTQAELAVEALSEAAGLRTCTARLPRTPKTSARACALLDLGACCGPCVRGEAAIVHDSAVAAAREALAGQVGFVVALLHERIAVLAADERYEDAARVRDRLSAVLDGAQRAERLRVLARCRELVATRPGKENWEILVMRWGRLTAAGDLLPGRDPWGTVQELVAASEHVPEPARVGEAATVEETELLVDWLRSPGARLLGMAEDGPPFAYPRSGAHSFSLPPSRSEETEAWNTA